MTDPQQTMNQLFGQAEVRCLQMFAEAIRKADQCGKDKWGVTHYQDDRVRLNVGGLVVCTLHIGRIWFALDGSFARSPDYNVVQSSGDWQPAKPDYIAIPSINGYYIPSTRKKHNVVWPRIRKMTFALIDNAVMKYKKLRKPCQQSHSQQFMIFLRARLNQPDLLDPAY